MQRPWQEIETNCTNYLNTKYGTGDLVFTHEGGSDSEASDIVVSFKGSPIFNIEAKSPIAQCGQFVVLRDSGNKKFVFSDKNKTEPNDFTDTIIKEMNERFEYYTNPDVSAHQLPDNEELYANWIIDYYKNKNTRYFITEFESEYYIFPTEKLLKYFRVTATYRVKKSGSSKPSLKHYNNLLLYITKKYPMSEMYITHKDGKMWIDNYNSGNVRFSLDGNEYLIVQEESVKAQLRRLSKTNNSNVIFSLSLRENIENKEDEKEFLKELSSL